MRAPKQPYPSFSLALAQITTIDDGHSVSTAKTQTDEESNSNQVLQKDREDPLMRTVYYTHQESHCSTTYPFEVVNHISNASMNSTPDSGSEGTESLIVRLSRAFRQLLCAVWTCLP